jgi:hypothetical protein
VGQTRFREGTGAELLILFGGLSVSAAKKKGITGRYGQPADHPVNIYPPEGEYLKSFLLTVD